MQIIQVEAVGLDAFGSHGVIINHPIDPAGNQTAPSILRSKGTAHMVTALLEAGGKIGRHPAMSPQLVMVISGTLHVIGGNGQLVELAAGQAVLFEQGEQHQSVASTAATLAIMEFDRA